MTTPITGANSLALSSELLLQVRYMAPGSLAAIGRKARTHPKSQIRQIVSSIETFGFTVPVLVDEDNKIIAGNARVEAAILVGLESIPVVTLSHLNTEQKRAFVLAENKLATLSGWDKSVLKLEFSDLVELDLGFSLDVTGFLEPEVDALMFGADAVDHGDEIVPLPQKPTTRLGDLWLLGRHRILCGDATDPSNLKTLLKTDQVRTVFVDPPYNVRIGGHVTGAGQHEEFVMASGEMTDAEFTGFLEKTFQRLSDALMPGGLAYVCMDFRHMQNVLDAGKFAGFELLNLIVWDKGSGGMGSFYRSRHELIFLFAKSGDGRRNRVQLGRHGRDRHNVWCYPGVNGFGAEKARAREMHPTVKPLALVRDALLDSTARGDLVLDLFSGSGTTIVAAEDSGRRGAAMDLDPLYVDTTIVRWQDFSGQEARLESTGLTFREMRVRRSGSTDACAHDLPPARVRTRRAA